MAAIPTLEEEDARRPNRERESLVGERTRVVNRIKATLARLGIRGFKPTRRDAAEHLDTLRTPDGAALPPNTRAELRRNMARLHFVVTQLREIEDARQEGLATQPDLGPHATLCCTGRGRGRTGPYPVRGQAMRTDSGRPSSSMRLSAWTPTLTSVARRRSVRHRMGALKAVQGRRVAGPPRDEQSSKPPFGPARVGKPQKEPREPLLKRGSSVARF